MSPLEKEVIRRKLAVIAENLNALASIRGMKTQEYVAELYKRKATERLLQELIEAAADVNTHIIVGTGNRAPDDYYESFVRMGELRILPVELARRLAPSAGLRNRLVHEYDVLDHSIVLDAAKMAGDLYPEYVRRIEDFLAAEET